ncbi:hypothetical protein HK096_008362, partial [Nowakowskiella sp. JEL0078]
VVFISVPQNMLSVNEYISNKRATRSIKSWILPAMSAATLVAMSSHSCLVSASPIPSIFGQHEIHKDAKAAIVDHQIGQGLKRFQEWDWSHNKYGL